MPGFDISFFYAAFEYSASRKLVKIIKYSIEINDTMHTEQQMGNRIFEMQRKKCCT